MKHTEERVTTIGWNMSREVWEVWKNGSCIAHARTLRAAQAKFPGAVVIKPSESGF